MKKIFSLFVASVMAMSLFAGELTMDLSTAQGYSSEGGSCTPVVAEGVLDASWTVAKAWDVAGVEFVLPDLTGVTKINFDLKGDGQEVTLYVYLVDANGGLKWEAEHWISLSSTAPPMWWATPPRPPSVSSARFRPGSGCFRRSGGRRHHAYPGPGLERPV